MFVYPTTLDSMLESVGHDSREPDARFSYKPKEEEYGLTFMESSVCEAISKGYGLHRGYIDTEGETPTGRDVFCNLVWDIHSPFREAILNIDRHILGDTKLQGHVTEEGKVIVDLYMADRGLVFDVYHDTGGGFDPSKAISRFLRDPYHGLDIDDRNNRRWGFSRFRFSRGIQVSFSGDGVHTYILADIDHLLCRVDYPFLSEVEAEIARKERPKYVTKSQTAPFLSENLFLKVQASSRPIPNQMWHSFKYLLQCLTQF